MGKLETEFPNDYQERIERLSEYIASTGKKYKNHLATIRAWSRKEQQQFDNKPRKKYIGDSTGEDYSKLPEWMRPI